MTITKNPDSGLPAYAPQEQKVWSAGNGERVTKTWRGARDDVDTEYETQRALADAGNGVEQLESYNDHGRGTLVARFSRTGVSTGGYPEEVTVIEELYAVDKSKDIVTADYFTIDVDAGKGLPLSDDDVAWVRRVSEEGLSEVQITAVAKKEGVGAFAQWANWSTGMKELRYHLTHGVETFFETAFVLRRSLFGVRNSQIKASFTGINTVDTAPTFDSQMEDLIEALPAGEWLYKPPQAEHLGRGKWRITLEWQWAEMWSIVYGGTWNLP